MRPRAARVCWVIVVGLFLLLLSSHHYHTDVLWAGWLWSILFWVAVYLSFTSRRYRRQNRAKTRLVEALLQTGELAFGRVVHQETLHGEDGDYGSVHYVFVDGANRGFIGQGTDNRGGLAEGAPTLVFYDPLDPNQNIALDCSTIKLKASDSLEAQARANSPELNPPGRMFKDILR